MTWSIISKFIISWCFYDKKRYEIGRHFERAYYQNNIFVIKNYKLEHD